jgi:ribosomal protein L44E
MIYDKKKEMRRKHLKMPPAWILGTIKREFNLSESNSGMLEDMHDHHETTLVYWRQNRRQYLPAWLWDIFYYDLLFKSFESRYELGDWCKARMQQLNDPMYCEEQRLKAEEEKRLAWRQRQKNKGGMRHPGLGNIKKPYRKRRTDVIERLTLGVRPQRLGHCHDHRQVISPLSYI